MEEESMDETFHECSLYRVISSHIRAVGFKAAAMEVIDILISEAKWRGRYGVYYELRKVLFELEDK